MAIINKQDTNGTKPLLGKGELGYDDYAIGGDTGRVYVGTGTENIALAERLESNMMTKAQFNALAEERKANRGGSGFDEFGAGNSEASKLNINYGMHVWSGAQAKYISLGRETDFQGGISKTLYAKLNINGVNIKLGGVAHEGIVVNNNRLDIILPTAPNIYPHDTVLTAEQIASGVIKHADSSNSGLIVMGKNISGTTFNQTVTVVNGKKYIIEYKDNGVRKTLEITASSTSYIVSLSGTNITEVGMYPADAISRSDLVFLESWHEDISEKNFVYPLGNVQYLGADTDGLTGITNGAFTGFETYSLFGNWQTPSALIGKGYVWSSLTEAQKKAFIANPENNCYLDGDKTIQVRYRVRVVQGLGDSWGNVDPNIQSTGTNAALKYGSYFVLAKGKQVFEDTFKTILTLSSDFFYSGNAQYGYKSVNGVFDGVESTGAIASSTLAYEGKCFALPIALVHR